MPNVGLADQIAVSDTPGRSIEALTTKADRRYQTDVYGDLAD